VRPQPAQDFDEFDRSPVAIFALQHGTAEHAEFLVEPAVDDIDRHSSPADAVKRDRELAQHHRVPKSRMNGDQRPDVVEPRGDRARHDPGGEIVAEMPLGEQDELETDLISRLQQFYAEIELRIEPSGRQWRQCLRHRLRDFGRTDSRHRNGRVETKLHHDTTSSYLRSSAWRTRSITLAGAAAALASTFSTSAPVTRSTSRLARSASLRKSGSRMVAAKADRSTATRSGGR